MVGDLRSPIGLSLAMEQKPYAEEESALKLLLGHRVCPAQTAYVRGISTVDFDLWSVCGVTGWEFLARVFYNCEQRCRCERCEA